MFNIGDNAWLSLLEKINISKIEKINQINDDNDIFVLKQGLVIYLTKRSFNFILWSAETVKSTIRQVRFFFFFFFFWLSVSFVVWPRLDDLFASPNPEFCVSHSPGQILSYEYIACSYGHISMSYTIPSELLVMSSFFCFLFFVLICCIRLPYDRPFRLHYHITNIFYFVASSLFLL